MVCLLYTSEIQIRTQEMHKTAEYGIAAHWKYKESNDGKKSVAAQEEEKLSWLRQILEWQRDMSDNREFLNLIKGDLDLFAEDVYCFTPQGDVKNLPNGSTPIDFAYAIHSAVGNKMVGARVNGKLVTIDYKIQNGDRIETVSYTHLDVYKRQGKDYTKEELLEPSVLDGVLEKLGGMYPESEIRDAFSDVVELTEEGRLFVPDTYECMIDEVKKRKTVVKALCLHIAHDCNLACKYCFAEEGEYHGRRALMSFRCV